MDVREEMKRWMMVFIQAANEADSKDIQKDVELFLDAAGQLTHVLRKRNETLGRQCRPQRKASASPPKPAPTKPQKQPAKPKQSDDTDGFRSGAKDRAQELSGVQQGIEQAMNKPAQQPPTKQQLLRQLYGGMDDEKRLRLAARELSR